ncbi:MAG: 50S ribosomal protein L11 methyltransferase [Betaproteobacteria bacterium]|nr:50S ribosomal protein L11 methyltransferase [Betaproteobacteria bacterium]
MALTSLVLELDAGDAMALSEALLEAGALSVSAEDAQAGAPDEVPMYDEFGSELPDPSCWPLMRLRVLVDAATRPADLLASAAGACSLSAVPDHIVEPVEDADWVRRTQAQFAPIEISPRLWIVPSWHRPPKSDAINIELDPGIAFGTGSHPTTKLCLRWLDTHVRAGDCVLDYGCGSGILAIAAARLGAGRIVGVDIDSAAVEAARKNARRNGVSGDFRDAAAALPLQADLVVANILSNPLKVLAPVLAAHARPGGRIALSGVLTPQAGEVAAAYAPWFDFGTGAEEEGWICLSGRRR